MTDWRDTCHCGNSLFWWRSRSGYRVCMRCCRDPLGALETLGRRIPGGVQRVKSLGLQDPRHTMTATSEFTPLHPGERDPAGDLSTIVDRLSERGEQPNVTGVGTR